MFDLLREDQEVIDAPGAGSIICKKGSVEFNNVSFGYVPERLVLKNVTFFVPSGKTVALVRMFLSIYEILNFQSELRFFILSTFVLRWVLQAVEKVQ